MLPLFVLFTFGSLPFWLLLAVASAVIVYGLESEEFGLPVGTFIATIVLLCIGGDLISVLPATINYPKLLIGSIIGYVLAGVTFGIVKWVFHSLSIKHDYEETKREWLSVRNISGNIVPDELKTKFSDFLRNGLRWNKMKLIDGKRVTVIHVVPEAWDHKSLIINWMAWWPWCFFWSIFDDILREVFRCCQVWTHDFMNWTTRLVFRNIENDFLEHTPNE